MIASSMKGTTFELQAWKTIRGNSSFAGVMQEVEDWVDTSKYTMGVVRVEAPYISGCCLYLQGCDQTQGAYTDHATFTGGQTAASLVYLLRSAPYGASDRLNKLLRWKVLSPGTGDWEVCFRMTTVLK